MNWVVSPSASTDNGLAEMLQSDQHKAKTPQANPGDNIRDTFSCKSLAYLLSLSLQRLQVVGHSFQLLFKLSTFAVISEGRQERGGWKIQSSKRNRRKQGEKIEKNENNYRAKERPQKQLNPSHTESNSLRCQIPLQAYIAVMTRQKLSAALGLHRNIYIAFTHETVQLLFGCTRNRF